MRRPRFYIEQGITVGQSQVLPEFAADHATRVLRMRVGDSLLLFNGDGHDYAARITEIRKNETRIQIEVRENTKVESPLTITLVQAIARGERMDWILQKATETGVTYIVPVVSERTEVRMDEDRAGKRLAHWSRVIASACEQSGRNILPGLAPPQTLAQYASTLAKPIEGELRLCLHPEAARRLMDFSKPSAVTVAIGPEGGFSERDLGLLTQVGFLQMQLGPRVLRTETAGPVAIAALQTRFGDFG